MPAIPERNVLLIVLDQWRADALGRAGNALISTPNLDRLAADGVLFSRHYSNCSPCAPARASLLTGQYQHNHGVMRNGTPLDARFTNLALECRKAGYDPALFGYTDTAADPRQHAPDDPVLRSYEQVMRGFTTELYLPERPLRWMAHLSQLGYPFAADPQALYRPDPMPGARGPTHAPARFAAAHSISAYLTDEVLSYIAMRREEPWFVHAAYIRPHPPFIASDPYHDRVDPDRLPPVRRAESAALEGATHPLVSALLADKRAGSFFAHGQGLVTDLPDSDLAQLRATYYGMVSEVDAQVGRLITQLQEWGLYDRTLIMVTSDHGEMLGDHWMLGKDSPFEQAFQVPLIVRDPTPAANPGRGRIETRFTEAVDLMPTVLQWVGLPVPRQCDGRSLLELCHHRPVEGGRDSAHWEFDFRDTWLPNAQSRLGLPMDQCGLAALRTETHLYVHFAALPPLLYDLRQDPHCLADIASDPAAAPVLLDCAQRLLSWRMKTSARELTGMSTAPDGLQVRG